MMSLTTLLKQVMGGDNLTRDEAEYAMSIIHSKEAPETQIAAFFSAVHTKGETTDELLGFLTEVKKQHDPIYFESDDIIDTSGTGGDGKDTFNISTTAALILAGAGIKVAKHGGGSVSSQCGSLEVLKQLGIEVSDTAVKAKQLLERDNFVFLHAPRFNSVFEEMADMRKSLGVPTTLNVLGPLAHPANIKRQFLGCYKKELLHPMVEVLQQSGATNVLAVYSNDGLDEISIAAPTTIVQLTDNCIRQYVITPEEMGIPRGDLNEIRGGDPTANADIIRRILAGEKSAYRDAAIINAGAAAVVSGKVANIREGIALAENSIDSGAALVLLQKSGGYQ